jgi:hypothetical protein
VFFYMCRGQENISSWNLGVSFWTSCIVRENGIWHFSFLYIASTNEDFDLCIAM